ncbi:MAG: hypothetical protein FWE32_02750 [Oscillospiraceae bacterium]|nr:hypothetical protein [Oscillospiraceae bacterium]
MVSMIVGNKGSGKTKNLINQVREAATVSKGNVVCIEKGDSLRFDLNYQIRLIDIEEYRISGPAAYYGFVCGLLAGNYDITHIFGDATFKILCGKDARDFEALAVFVEDLAKLTASLSVSIVLTVSCEQSDLPERVHSFIQK